MRQGWRPQGRRHRQREAAYMDIPVRPNISLRSCLFTVRPSGQARVLAQLAHQGPQLQRPSWAREILLLGYQLLAIHLEQKRTSHGKV